jgi:hypothetical protein
MPQALTKLPGSPHSGPPLSVTYSGRRLLKCQTTSLEGEGEGA